jgi:hypothetical protein
LHYQNISYCVTKPSPTTTHFLHEHLFACTTKAYRTFHFTPTLSFIPCLFSRRAKHPLLARTSRRVVMSQQHHQQLEGDSTIIGSSPKPRSSEDDEMSSTNNEKTLDAEAGLQPQKPPGGPPGGPPPNGGLTAWLQVLGGFFLFFNTWVSMFGSLHSWCTVCLMF